MEESRFLSLEEQSSAKGGSPVMVCNEADIYYSCSSGTSYVLCSGIFDLGQCYNAYGTCISFSNSGGSTCGETAYKFKIPLDYAL